MKTLFQSRLVRRLLWIAVPLGAILVVLLAVRLITGKPLGLRSFVRDQIYLTYSLGKTFAARGEVQALAQGNYTDILFLHHSVGAGFINEGHLRDLFAQKGYTMWDQGYSYEGLRGPDGTPQGYTYNIPSDNTDPDGLYTLFSQKTYGLPVNGLSQVMQHEVILFKSCFPINDMDEDQQLETIKTYYLGIRNTVDQHPDRLFVLFTTPPLNPAETDADNAARARALANWLKSENFTGARDNLVVFDLFDALAEGDAARQDVNMLREVYRKGIDSHPNPEANAVIAKSIADFVDQQIVEFRAVSQIER